MPLFSQCKKPLQKTKHPTFFHNGRAPAFPLPAFLPQSSILPQKTLIARLSPYDKYLHHIIIFFHYITLSEEK